SLGWRVQLVQDVCDAGTIGGIGVGGGCDDIGSSSGDDDLVLQVWLCWVGDIDHIDAPTGSEMVGGRSRQQSVAAEDVHALGAVPAAGAEHSESGGVGDGGGLELGPVQAVRAGGRPGPDVA